MRAIYIAALGILSLFLSACVSGDEITGYVIDPDGSIAFSIYRQNLISSEAGDNGKRDLAAYIKALEERNDSLFTKLLEAGAQEVQVTILRRTSPASALITGRIPSLDGFAAYLTDEGDADDSLICTAISADQVQGIRCELTRNPPEEVQLPNVPTPEEARPGCAKSSAGPLSVMRIALAEGSFTVAQGFLLSPDKRSAILDEDTISKMWNANATSITFALEWSSPEAQ